MSEITNAADPQFSTAFNIENEGEMRHCPLKLQIEYSCFRNSDTFAVSSNTIKFLARYPEYEHDGHRTIMKALGSSQNYKYYTEGNFIIKGDGAKLFYREDDRIGLSGELISLNFSHPEDKRSSLLYEQISSKRRLLFTKGQTVNILNIGGVGTEICILTKKLVNTLSENGGRLILDYETAFFGMTMYSARLEIIADKLKPKQEPEYFDADGNPTAALKRSFAPKLLYIAGKI